MACVVLARARGCAGVSAETSHAIACSGPRSAGQAPFNLWAVPQLALILPAQGQTCRPHHGFPSSAQGTGGRPRWLRPSKGRSGGSTATTDLAVTIEPPSPRLPVRPATDAAG